MKQSSDRILTTHTGRLERPEAITSAMEQNPDGRPTDAAFAGRLKTAVTEIVNAQVQAGVDIVNDGEFGKLELEHLSERTARWSRAGAAVEAAATAHLARP